MGVACVSVCMFGELYATVCEWLRVCRVHCELSLAMPIFIMTCDNEKPRKWIYCEIYESESESESAEYLQPSFVMSLPSLGGATITIYLSSMDPQ